MGIFFALTIYAYYSGYDFTTCGGFLFSFVIVMILSGLFLMFTNSNTAHIIYCAMGVLMFSLYILYDT